MTRDAMDKWQNFTANVRERDPFPDTVRSRSERAMWLSAIRCASCKCEYCVWGIYLGLLIRHREVENVIRLGGAMRFEELEEECLVGNP